MRAGACGHIAPEARLKAIYESSINNPARAIRESWKLSEVPAGIENEEGGISEPVVPGQTMHGF
jgi:hypothetical protein